MTNQDKTCYIIRGAAGTAKTRKAVKLTGDARYVSSADDFPGIYNEQGVYQKDQQELSHKWALAKLEELLKQGIPEVAYANTSMKKVFYWEAVKLALSWNYAVDVSLSEGVMLPDGTPTKSIHNVPYGAISYQLNSYERFVYPVKTPFQEYPNDRRNKIVQPGPKLQVFDRDNTILTSRDGSGFPTKGNMLLLPGVRSAMTRMKQKGDYIIVVSNQAGVEQGHKSKFQLWEETIELAELMPVIDAVLYCPDFNGEELLIWKKVMPLREFERHARSPNCQPFRKPAGGMLEVLMEMYAGKFIDACMYGNGPEDSMCAAAAGFNFRHIHELLVDQWRYENCGG
jgi:histidinol phosphatase-like enzyme